MNSWRDIINVTSANGVEASNAIPPSKIDGPDSIGTMSTIGMNAARKVRIGGGRAREDRTGDTKINKALTGAAKDRMRATGAAKVKRARVGVRTIGTIGAVKTIGANDHKGANGGPAPECKAASSGETLEMRIAKATTSPVRVQDGVE
jgi:hypothetical protein